MAIDLNSMAMFTKVVEYKSFTEASRRTGIPVSTISRRIALLEKSLNVRLLERSTRKLRLTELGHEYYEHCCRAMQELETANLIIHDRQTEVSGLLRISVPPSLEKCLVIPLVIRFQALYPKARIRIWVTNQKMNLVEDNIDLALRVGGLEDSSLIARKLIEYRHILVASPRYLKKFGAPKHPLELEKHRLICFNDWYGSTTWRFAKGNKKEKLDVKETLSINDFIGAQFAAEADLGITELPSIICNHALQEKKLIEVLPDWHFSPLSEFKIKLYFVYPSNRNLSRLVKLFKDYCVDQAENILNKTD